jgi:hypothetical protein
MGVGEAGGRVGAVVAVGATPMTWGVATMIGVGVRAGVGDAARVAVGDGVAVLELSTRTATVTSS